MSDTLIFYCIIGAVHFLFYIFLGFYGVLRVRSNIK